MSNEETFHNMGLIEHLRELRSRLFKMVVAVGIAFVFAYIYSGEIYGLLMEPLISKLPASSRFV
ncbi:MAG: twin-arginine translocase subunit TatC, partial [Deltaproteobacteria bacterium]|nr:twin-arginine translocase subunit TatC [Deltaproteobacteria bacterium]